MSHFECLCVPDVDIRIIPGCKVKLGRFKNEYWTVGYGWYTWGGNRPFCGWYLINDSNGTIKPLQRTDTDDIYIIET